MSEKEKAFSAGALLMGLLVTIVVSVMSWIGLKASEVPVLQQQLREMNTNIANLNKSLNKVDEFIHHHEERRIAWNVWQSQIDTRLKTYDVKMQRTRLELEGVHIKCEHNEGLIEEILDGLNTSAKG